MDKSFIKHLFIIGSGTIINMLIGLITTPIITRVVGPIEYGKLSIFSMYGSIGLMIFCLGLDQSLVRYFYKHDTLDYKKEVLYKCCILPIISSTILGIIIVILSYAKVIVFEFNPRIMFLLSLSTIAQIINRFSILIVRLEYNSKLFSILNIIQKVIYVGMVLVLINLLKIDKFDILAISITFSYIVPTVLGIISQKRIWKIDKKEKENFVNQLELMKYGAPYIISTGLTVLFQTIDKMALSRYCSYLEVGIYSSAMTLVNIFAIIQSTFNTLWTPMSIKHYEEHPDDKEFYQKVNEIITVIMFFCGIILILFKDIFAILLGEKYRQSAYILPFLIFNPIMYTISETTICGIVFKKKSNMHIFIALGACISNILGNIFLVPIYGGKGAAISTGFSYILFWALRTAIANKYFYINFKIKKMCILLLVTIINAWYNTFYAFGLLNIVLFLINLFILVVLYFKIIKEHIVLCFTKIKNYIN